MDKAQLDSYDYIVIAFSGGKDSAACALTLLEMGAPKNRMMLWHHDIDGREGSFLMDWPVTQDYCRKFSACLDLPLYFSWKQGGFEREMLRENARTAPICFETLDGTVKQTGGTRGKKSTRRKFPQVSPDLSVRFCTAYLKIDVGACAIRNQSEFVNKRTLFVTGERAQESACRAKYQVLEPDRTDNRDGKRIKRHVDHYRPVHSWDERKVWEIMERWQLKAHPCYYLGWGRCSCAACIFGSKDQWASLAKVAPEQIKRIIDYEKQFGLTINRTKSVPELIAAGKDYDAITPGGVTRAMSHEYSGEVKDSHWELPAGAYGESTGPS